MHRFILCMFVKLSPWPCGLKAISFMLKCCIMQHENSHNLYDNLHIMLYVNFWPPSYVIYDHVSPICLSWYYACFEAYDVICKFMNIFMPHMPPCLTCGQPYYLMPFLSCFAKFPLLIYVMLCETYMRGECVGFG